MDLVHGGRRLPPPGVLVVRRLVRGQRPALGRAALLDTRSRPTRPVAAVHAFWFATSRPRRAGVPCELLRSRRLRTLDRDAAAYRVRVGDHRGDPRPGHELSPRRLPLERASASTPGA